MTDRILSPPFKAGSLGPQCLTCRRRRVKCDSTKPTCLRCQSDEIQCRGYNRGLKVIQFIPSHSTKINKRHVKQERSESESESEDIPLSLRSLSSDRDELAVVDAIVCYNNYVVPDASPDHRPFKRQVIQKDVPWQILPKVVQYMFIVTLRTLQAAQNWVDPFLRPEICYYRGLSLGELKQHLPEALVEPYGIALACILLLMATDIHSTADKSWLLHFQAAGKIIFRRGGMPTCLYSLPLLRGPLINYMIIDVFTATTCSSGLLFPDSHSFANHLGYLNVLPGLEEDILASPNPCPLAIFQAVTSTNILRSFRRRITSSPKPPVGCGGTSPSEDFQRLLTMIDSFDSYLWAVRALRMGQCLPEPPEKCPELIDISAFTSLALCYKSASLIYLILSCAQTYDIQKQELLRRAKQTLDQESNLLLTTASCDHDGPLHSRLWKFLTWPLVISIYARVGWDIGFTEETVDIELERLQERAAVLGLRRVYLAVRHFRDLRKMRNASDPPNREWDDGLSGRALFSV